jgi:alkylhydroperoxidase family enzyme
MKPMFLPAVEANPQPGPYAETIRMMQAHAKEYPQIWHMFAFRADITAHLARFTQEVMHGEAPLTPGLRELIAAYTSSQNHCPF